MYEIMAQCLKLTMENINLKSEIKELNKKIAEQEKIIEKHKRMQRKNTKEHFN